MKVSGVYFHNSDLESHGIVFTFNAQLTRPCHLPPFKLHRHPETSPQLNPLQGRVMHVWAVSFSEQDFPEDVRSPYNISF